MNTHETLILIDTARLLKQTGFKWNCNWRYIIFNEGTVHEVIRLEDSHDWPPQNYNRFDDTYSAPTQATAQKWLREVKGISIVVFPENKYYNYYLFNCSNNNYSMIDFYEINSDTYEDALEAGLQKCLTLLIEQK